MWAEYGFIRPHIGYAVNNKYVEYISADCVLLQNNIKHRCTRGTNKIK